MSRRPAARAVRTLIFSSVERRGRRAATRSGTDLVASSHGRWVAEGVGGSAGGAAVAEASRSMGSRGDGPRMVVGFERLTWSVRRASCGAQMQCFSGSVNCYVLCASCSIFLKLVFNNHFTKIKV